MTGEKLLNFILDYLSKTVAIAAVVCITVGGLLPVVMWVTNK